MLSFCFFSGWGMIYSNQILKWYGDGIIAMIFVMLFVFDGNHLEFEGSKL
jgi:hypothetical protein